MTRPRYVARGMALPLRSHAARRPERRGRVGGGEAEALARYQAARIASLLATLGRSSHDLRGVLSPALLAAERLHASPEPGVRRVGEIVARAVDRAAEVIQNALDLARDGVREGVRETRARAVLRDLVPTDGVSYEAGDIAVHDIDPAALTEAFSALVRDARSRGATEIHLRATPEMTLLLTDDGTVPPPEAFRPMPGRGERGYSRATARELVRSQGGDMVHDGAGFRITLAGARRGSGSPGSA